jgi:hypothetical protein
MLYRRTDDVERLQKVITDTKQQFTGSLQQIKMLGKEKEQRQKELEDLRGAAKKCTAGLRCKNKYSFPYIYIYFYLMSLLVCASTELSSRFKG